MATTDTASNDNGIVINCPTCHRTIWEWATCDHGKPPEVVLHGVKAEVVEVEVVKKAKRWGREG